MKCSWPTVCLGVNPQKWSVHVIIGILSIAGAVKLNECVRIRVCGRIARGGDDDMACSSGQLPWVYPHSPWNRHETASTGTVATQLPDSDTVPEPEPAEPVTLTPR
jgi:hypothetical protein